MLNKDMFWWVVCFLILGIHFMGSQIVEPMRAVFHTIGVVLAATSGIVLSAHFLHRWFNKD